MQNHKIDVAAIGLSRRYEEDRMSEKKTCMSSADEEHSHLEVHSDLGKVLLILARKVGIVVAYTLLRG